MEMKDNPIVEIQNVSFSYNKNQSKILDSVNATIRRGKFTVVLGKNGSGKSTLLRILSGIKPFDSGSIKIMGKEFEELSLIERAKIMSFLSQNHKPVFPFKVSEVVLTGRAPYSGYFPSKNDNQKVYESLNKLELLQLKDRIYSELSGGEQQLVMIARIIAQETKLLFLDEPISHLDFNNQIRVIKLLKKMVSEGYSIVVSLHDPNFAFLAGDDFLLINDGRIILTENEKPWENKELNEIFNKDILKFDYRNKTLFIPDL